MTAFNEAGAINPGKPYRDTSIEDLLADLQ